MLLGPVHLSLSVCSPAGRYAAELHESSTKESSRPVSRQPSDIRALLAGPSVASSITSLALPDHAQVNTIWG